MDKKKLRFVILKALDEKKDPFIELQSEEIPEQDIFEQGGFLQREGYIIGNAYADNTIYIWGRLTEQGEQFLEDNKGWRKAYKGLKELRDWIKWLSLSYRFLKSKIWYNETLKHGCQQFADIFYLIFSSTMVKFTKKRGDVW